MFILVKMKDAIPIPAHHLDKPRAVAVSHQVCALGGRTSAGAARASRTVPCRLAQRRKSVYAIWGWSWQIEEKYCNRVLLENGLCICLYELLDLGDGLIYQSDASVHVRAEFTYSAYARARAHTARCALVRASHLSQKSPSGPHALPAYYGRDSPRGAGARENSCSGSARQAAPRETSACACWLDDAR